MKKKDRCDNNPQFTCMVSEEERKRMCRTTGFCPIADEDGW